MLATVVCYMCFNYFLMFQTILKTVDTKIGTFTLIFTGFCYQIMNSTNWFFLFFCFGFSSRCNFVLPRSANLIVIVSKSTHSSKTIILCSNYCHRGTRTPALSLPLIYLDHAHVHLSCLTGGAAS